MIPKYPAKVKKNQLSIEEPYKTKLRDYLFTLEGKEVELSSKQPRLINDRSTQQNRYMWGVVYQILSDEIGYTVDEVHEIMKSLFLKKNFNFKDCVVTAHGSTAELTTTAMEEYLDKIKSWSSSQLGIYIPEPNEVVNESS